MPVVGVLNCTLASAVAAFRRGMSETDHVEGRNVVIEVRASGQAFEVGLVSNLGGPDDVSRL